MFATVRQRNFALLWFGGLISMAGDWMLFIALPIFVYEATESTLATGVMLMASMLPRLLLGSVAGVFVDRWERKRTMVISNLLMGLSLLPLLLVQSAESLWIVYIVAFVQSAVGQFFGPAETALLPKLVGEEHLVSANALNALNNNLARFIGPALGGLVTAWWGLHGVVIADIATFVIAAGLIAAINITSQVMDKVKETEAPAAVWRKVWVEWRDGLRVIRRQRTVLVLFVAFTITGLGEGIISTLFVPFVKDVMHGDALQLGWLMSAQAVGGLIGGVVIGWIGVRVLPYKLTGIGAILFGFIDLTIFNYPLFIPGVELGLLLFVLVGIPASGMMAGFSTLIQTNVSDEYMGRVSGALGTSFALMTLIGMTLAGVLGEIIAVLPLINVQGIVYIAAGVIALTMLHPRSVEVYQTQPSLEGVSAGD